MISIRSGSKEETILLDEFEARVREGLITPSTPVRFPVLTGERWVDARDLELFRRLYAPARIHFSRAFTLSSFPVVTFILVIVQALVYFGIAGANRAIPLEPLIEAGAKVQPNILELGETWRLFSANILHRDVLHLLFNMFFLFNVGGTIENAYRFQDYLLIIVVSALMTTGVSTLLSSVPSVGASGIVLGLFGSASVFGYKYGEILPQRYRRYFGGAVLPYAIFILYVGLATRDTDNWGHLGGLVGGILATIPLDPKLLHMGRARRSFALRNAPGIAAIAIVLAVLALGGVVRAVGPRFAEIADARSGISVPYVWMWGVGENHLGYPSWGNTQGANVGIRAERKHETPANLVALKRKFLQDELRAREHEGDIAQVTVLDERAANIEGGSAVQIGNRLESRAGPMVTRTVLIVRGYYSYTVVMSAPERWADAYAPIFDHIFRGIRLTEPQTLVRARRSVQTFPGMASAHSELASELADIGRVDEAAQAYRRALSVLPGFAEARFGLAKLFADYNGDLKKAEEMARALHDEKPEEPAYAVLLADIQRRLGHVDDACGVLQQTVDRISEPPERLRERLRAMDCRFSAWLER